MLLVFPWVTALSPILVVRDLPAQQDAWEDDDGMVAPSSGIYGRTSLLGEVVTPSGITGHGVFAQGLHRSPCTCWGTRGFQARDILDILIADSPQSTKALRRETGLTGRPNERIYERALKELWTRLFIVGFGEIDEGAFPSLAMGATKVLFEDLHTKASTMGAEEAAAGREALFKSVPLARKFYEKTLPSPTVAPLAKVQQQKKSADRGYIEFEDL